MKSQITALLEHLNNCGSCDKEALNKHMSRDISHEAYGMQGPDYDDLETTGDFHLCESGSRLLMGVTFGTYLRGDEDR